jgi:hypothetical protein
MAGDDISYSVKVMEDTTERPIPELIRENGFIYQNQPCVTGVGADDHMRDFL